MVWLHQLFMAMVILPFCDTIPVNVARGKPTFQASVYQAAVSSRAVDGNKDPGYAHGSCTHTSDGGGWGTSNPWWALDMLWRRRVDSVHITNRNGEAGDRLHNVRIGVTDVSPQTTAPTPSNINICASQNAAVARGATQQFTCRGQGRYLVVLIEGTGKMLTLCEVEVYVASGREDVRYHATTNSRLVGHVMESMEARSAVQCATMCQQNAQCSSFNMAPLSPGSLTCELNEDVSDAQTMAGLVTVSSYVFYKLDYLTV